MRRRTFVQRALETGLVAPLGARRRGRGGTARAVACSRAGRRPDDGAGARRRRRARRLGRPGDRIADPVLTNLAAGTLKRAMPVEQAAGADRRAVTHLEAFGRLLAGLAPWLELPADDTAEGATARALRRRWRGARIAQAVDPASPDVLNFTTRSPAAGGRGVPRAGRPARAARARRRLDAGDADAPRRARSSRRARSRPASTTGCCSRRWSRRAWRRSARRWDRTRVDYALRQHEQWYKGDGVYGDGPEFHWDYYNSFVIQPMLLDVARRVRRRDRRRGRRCGAGAERAPGATPRSRSG